MKETKIAKENVEKWVKTGLIYVKVISAEKQNCKTHKQTCQRWLEFCEENKYPTNYHQEVLDKITDLKQAIKLYEDNGI